MTEVIGSMLAICMPVPFLVSFYQLCMSYSGVNAKKHIQLPKSGGTSSTKLIKTCIFAKKGIKEKIKEITKFAVIQEKIIMIRNNNYIVKVIGKTTICGARI